MNITAENLNRTKKLLLDTGEVTDLNSLDAAFSRYGMVVLFGPDDVATFEGQLALITMINLAARSMDGQVELQGPLDTELMLPGFVGKSVGEAASLLGIKAGHRCQADAPTLALKAGTAAIVPVAAGWRAAAIGAECMLPFVPGKAEPLAVIAAAALAVNEAFHVLRQDHPLAGARVVGLNLWAPDVIVGWESAALDGPQGVTLREPVLVAGLGHLGQAYLWSLAMQLRGGGLPELWLQDDDNLSDSTWSTSMLTPKKFVKERKARLIAKVVESMGFATRVIEQRLLNAGQLTDEAPKLVLFGVDNPHARRLISRLPAVVLVEAGLGERHDTFRSIRVHGFPQAEDSAAIWAERQVHVRPTVDVSEDADASLAPAYRRMLERTKDRCGTTTLASRSVGVPFVGCMAACLVLSEFFRRLYGYTGFAVQEFDLRELRDRELVAA